MFAVFETGGKQYRAEKGSVIQIEKLPEAEGSSVTFERVFLFSDGKTTEVGMPFVEGVKIVGKIAKHGRREKIRVVKFQAKKRHKTIHGHRQYFTEVEITDIKKSVARKDPEKKAEEKAEKKKIEK